MIRFSQEDIFIVTGGSSGIGKAICINLINLGAKVIAMARDMEKLEQLRTEIESGDNMITISRDLADDIDSIPRRRQRCYRRRRP